ncbi:MAG: sulfite exporter TauE/SafE family protein [Deltaproteobacteria bacterium]|nr:sulfite exporter TauE/SafE family protein [Candidatus Anaeroferrophillus wilburensis]MBN2888394.1 sulfite exporter TauE/SafE family protein [Deltaproteobacteria bacterium]
MTELLTGMVTALWLGIITSISPCPLATNVAAISFIARHVGSPARVWMSGIVYAAGRVAAYVLLGALLVASLLSAPGVSHFLQKYMNQLLGPVLLITGLVLLGAVLSALPGLGIGSRLQRVGEHWGLGGAGLLGIVFALSFCPVSAALFFGSLLPLALRFESSIMIPSLYGLGTGLPVLIFAILIAGSTHSVGRFFNRLTVFERWARRLTGLIFLAVGIYYCLIYNFAAFAST